MESSTQINFSMEEYKSLLKTVRFALINLGGSPLCYPETFHEIDALRIKLNEVIQKGEDIVKSPELKSIEEDVECPSPLDLNAEDDEIVKEEEEYDDPPYP